MVISYVFGLLICLIIKFKEVVKMARKRADKNGGWYKTYQRVCASMHEKYPDMSVEAINYRAYKATNAIFRYYARKRRALEKAEV